jgi:hypothetical protein
VLKIELLEKVENDYDDWGETFDIPQFMTYIKSELSKKDFEKRNSRLVFSVCSDDVNRLQGLKTVENALTDDYNNEFHLGGLGAYPIGGVSGIIAASHHAPDKVTNGDRQDGNLIFFVSPHFGLVEKEKFIYGKIIRPGQKNMTNSCGAMMGLLESLEQAESLDNFKALPDPNNVDPTRHVLHSELINKYEEWLKDILQMKDRNEQVVDLFKLNYDLVINKTTEMIDKFLEEDSDHFEGKIALIGGLTVNTTSGDNFILKDINFPKS